MVILLSCTKSDFSYSENVFENVLGNVSGGEKAKEKNGHSVVYILRGQSSTSGKMLHEDLFITSKEVNKNISIKVLTEVLL